MNTLEQLRVVEMRRASEQVPWGLDLGLRPLKSKYKPGVKATVNSVTSGTPADMDGQLQVR